MGAAPSTTTETHPPGVGAGVAAPEAAVPRAAHPPRKDLLSNPAVLSTAGFAVHGLGRTRGGRGGYTKVTSTTEMIISRPQLESFDSDTSCQPSA